MPSKRNIGNLDALTATLKAAAGSFFVVDYQGLSSAATGRLRKAVRDKGGEITVAKNTIITKAISDLGLASLGELKGPSAVVTFEDVAGVAKALKEFTKTNDKKIPAFKAGIVDGVVQDAKQLEVLATLPSRKELQAEFVGILGAKASELVGILESYVTKLEEAA